MRLIISRKGFDASAGGVPSPILDDGAMISLPIPSKHSRIRYGEIRARGIEVGSLVHALARGRVKRSDGAHLDPDVDPDAFPRGRGWRGLFGQAGAAQTVLHRERVGVGDVFLFYGWFKRTQTIARVRRYVPGARSVHVLWSWLQIAEVIALGEGARVPSWARYHPHVAGGDHLTRNTLYVASERLVVDGIDLGVPGAGVCARYDPRLQLTKEGASRSRWLLPAWFAPGPTRPALGMHGDPARWAPATDGVELQNVARGQEFVLDVDHYPEAKPWLADLVALARSP